MKHFSEKAHSVDGDEPPQGMGLKFHSSNNIMALYSSTVTQTDCAVVLLNKM
jgi:hypothetical protein